jgi:hypothetical protein
MAQSKWEKILTNVSLLSLVATVVGGVVTFFVQRSDQIEQRGIQVRANDRETRKPFLEKQSQVYFELVPLMARISVAGPLDASNSDIRRFWNLYWGEGGMVSDNLVGAALIDFGRTLKGAMDPANPTELRENCKKWLPGTALYVSHRIRQSLFPSWGIVDGGGGWLSSAEIDEAGKKIGPRSTQCWNKMLYE